MYSFAHRSDARLVTYVLFHITCSSGCPEVRGSQPGRAAASQLRPSPALHPAGPPSRTAPDCPYETASVITTSQERRVVVDGDFRACRIYCLAGGRAPHQIRHKYRRFLSSCLDVIRLLDP